MIDLFTGTNHQAYGIEAALSAERIPYRRIHGPNDAMGGLLLIASHRVPEAITRMALDRPALIVGKLPPALAGLFPEHAGLRTEALTVPLADLPLSAAANETARRFGVESLRLPQARIAGRGPLIATNGMVTWCRLDIGFTLASLLGETYYPAPRQSLTPRLIPAIYYRLPECIRTLLQRRVYAKLHNQLDQHPMPSGYPVEPAGWLLMELLKSLIRSQAGGLVRLGYWPAPYQFAATLTHDIEPSRFSYTNGLEELLRVNASSTHVPSYGLVAKDAMHVAAANLSKLRATAVYCHGSEHRGETVAGSRQQIENVIRRAKRDLEGLLKKRVTGFRSPRLDRSSELFEALDEIGFEYSSSAPDIDRESMARFGAGVRFNLPFRPPLQNFDGSVRASRCLEIPVSAPDCIQPLFMGESADDLQTAVDRKLDYIGATGGVYTGIVHGGVFDRADGNRRMRHLRFVADRMEESNAWVTGIDDIARWWSLREQVFLTSTHGRRIARNESTRPIAGLCFVEEDEAGNILQQTNLSTIEAHASVPIPSSNHSFSGAQFYATTI